MILSRELLNPVSYQTQDPFASIIEQMEIWLKEYQPEYLTTTWPQIKCAYLKRILKLASNGCKLKGYVHLAPTEDLSSTLFDIYQLLDRCIYFTSKYWRAFYYYLKTGSLNSAWPQFGQREINVALSLLSQEDIDKLKIEANKEWLDFYASEKEITSLFKRLKQPILNLCFKRVAFLAASDPAVYSIRDMQQQVYEALLIKLRKNDYFTYDQNKMLGWAIKCSDNVLHNIRDDALRKRGCIKTDKELIPNIPVTTKLIEAVTSIESIKIAEDIEEELCLKELLDAANPKINSYLRTICCGEHNPDFWTWFYYNEPTLSQKIAYVEENPEALGPYVQRHLQLPTYELVDFLKQHLPSLLEKTTNKILLAS